MKKGFLTYTAVDICFLQIKVENTILISMGRTLLTIENIDQRWLQEARSCSGKNYKRGLGSKQ